MKKVILAGVISSFISAAAFAAPTAPSVGDHDQTSATLTWKADVPVIIPGAWVTFTGEGGSMTLEAADLNVKADGTFKSEDIVLELHTYDAETDTPGDLIVVGTDQFDGVAVSGISYKVEAPAFTSKLGTDVSKVDAKVLMDGAEVATNAIIKKDEVVTTWSLEGSEVGTMIGGDEITATTVVFADVEFGTPA